MAFDMEYVEWVEPDRSHSGGKERVVLSNDIINALSDIGAVFKLSFDGATEYRSITVKMRQIAKEFGNGFNQNILTKPYTQKTLAKSGPHGDVKDTIEVIYKVEALRERF